jgi:ankyrin repeat protein
MLAKTYIPILTLILSLIILIKNEIKTPWIIINAFLVLNITQKLIILLNYIYEELIIAGPDQARRCAQICIKNEDYYYLNLALKKYPEIINDDFCCPLLFQAIESNKIRIVKCLLDAGANINIEYLETNILEYIKTDNLESIDINKMIFTKNIKNIFIQNKFKEMLNSNIFLSDFPLIELLIQYGANIKLLSNNHETMLLKISKIGFKASLYSIYTSELDVKDKDGMTSLFYACLSNDIEWVKLLIKNNCNINIIDNNGKSILDILNGCPHYFNIIKYLEEINNNKELLIEKKFQQIF